LAAGRKGWVQVARGSVSLDSRPLDPGDGAAIEGPAIITLIGSSESEILLFDMA
jgi:hypothetical protein